MLWTQKQQRYFGQILPSAATAQTQLQVEVGVAGIAGVLPKKPVLRFESHPAVDCVQ